MSKFCEKCGKPINEGAMFCGSCGSPASVPTDSSTEKVAQPKTYASKEEREAALAAVANDVKGGKFKKKKSPLAIIIPTVAVLLIVGIIITIVLVNSKNADENALVITNSNGDKVFSYNLDELVSNINKSNTAKLDKPLSASDFFIDDTNAFGYDEASPKSYYGYFDSKSNLYRIFTDSEGHIEHIEYAVLGSGTSSSAPDEIVFILRAFYSDLGFSEATEIVNENKNQLTSMDISGAGIFEDEDKITFSAGLKEARSISVSGAGDSSLIAPLKSYKDVIISYGTSNNYQIWYITVA